MSRMATAFRPAGAKPSVPSGRCLSSHRDAVIRPVGYNFSLKKYGQVP